MGFFLRVEEDGCTGAEEGIGAAVADGAGLVGIGPWFLPAEEDVHNIAQISSRFIF